MQNNATHKEFEERDNGPVMIPEVVATLESQKRRMHKNSKCSESLKIYNDVLAYAKKFSKITHKSSVENMKQELHKFGLTPIELSQIGSLFPTTTEELKILIPSLNERLSYENLSDIITIMQNY